MYIPSITTIFGCIFIIYISHAMWSLAQLFTTLKCTNTPCFKSYLSIKPKLQLALFTSQTVTPISSDVVKIGNVKNFDYDNEFQQNFEINIPGKTRRNGTLYLNVVIALSDRTLEWNTLQHGDGPTVIQRISLTEYAEPKAEAYNLLGDKPNNNNKESKRPLRKSSEYIKPVSHIKSIVHIIMLTDLVTMSYKDIPAELARLIRINRKQEFLPIIQSDFFNTRLKDLNQITKEMKKSNLTIHYKPTGIGKLRLMLQMEHATNSMLQLGFTHKDIDEIKGILSDTNYYLLLGTLFIGSIHLLFDFLSFKNDVQFWRKKRNYAGLSTRTTLWRGFSQIVIFLYLLDEDTSLLVVIPAGISTIIELWKCKKILKIEITLLNGFKFIKSNDIDNSNIAKAEKRTQEFDKEAMKYLCYILYPLCIAGAIYSLIYQPHRSWYSWTLNSLVNGVYAFGFLFMLPQLFINYKLKSVAALPWRAFMYKAFNTFIDDIFAFIITMPTAHRVACFRDDIVFIIYLYQRWLYPVDKSRIDSGLSFSNDDDVDNDNVNNDIKNDNNKMIKNEQNNTIKSNCSQKETKKLK